MAAFWRLPTASTVTSPRKWSLVKTPLAPGTSVQPTLGSKRMSGNSARGIASETGWISRNAISTSPIATMQATGMVTRKSRPRARTREFRRRCTPHTSLIDRVARAGGADRLLRPGLAS